MCNWRTVMCALLCYKFSGFSQQVLLKWGWYISSDIPLKPWYKLIIHVYTAYILQLIFSIKVFWIEFCSMICAVHILYNVVTMMMYQFLPHKTLHVIRRTTLSRYFVRFSSLLIYMIYLLTEVGLTPGGSSTVHIYTQTVHRTTQLTGHNLLLEIQGDF